MGRSAISLRLCEWRFIGLLFFMWLVVLSPDQMWTFGNGEKHPKVISEQIRRTEMCGPTGLALPTTMIENDRVRVTEWHFMKRGDNTGWHRHDYDYVVAPQFDGTLDIDLGNGELIQAEMQCGQPHYRELAIEHDVINANDFECAFVEIELFEPRHS